MADARGRRGASLDVGVRGGEAERELRSAIPRTKPNEEARAARLTCVSLGVVAFCNSENEAERAQRQLHLPTGDN